MKLNQLDLSDHMPSDGLISKDGIKGGVNQNVNKELDKVPKTTHELFSKTPSRSSKAVVRSRTFNSTSASVLSLKSQQETNTKRDMQLHKMVFEDAGLPDGTEVAYCSEGQKILLGYKRNTGIFCFCCASVVSASKFEAHAGFSGRRKPYHNIYTSNGISLHKFAMSLPKSRDCFTKDNDQLHSDACPRDLHRDTPAPSGYLSPTGKVEEVGRNGKRPRTNKENLKEASTSDLILAVARARMAR